MAAWLTRRCGDENKNRLRWTRTFACVNDIKGRNCASFVAEDVVVERHRGVSQIPGVQARGETLISIRS